jgi:hypothetical protein
MKSINWHVENHVYVSCGNNVVIKMHHTKPLCTRSIYAWNKIYYEVNECITNVITPCSHLWRSHLHQSMGYLMTTYIKTRVAFSHLSQAFQIHVIPVKCASCVHLTSLWRVQKATLNQTPLTDRHWKIDGVIHTNWIKKCSFANIFIPISGVCFSAMLIAQIACFWAQSEAICFCTFH